MIINNFMRKINFILILILFSAISLYSQDYTIEHGKIKVNGKDKKYKIRIAYPQIKGLNNASVNGFNKRVKKIMETERDSFVVWMKDWEINDYNKDFMSSYEIGDSIFYNDSKLVSVLFYVFYYFAGAAHPNNSNFSINYDLENNKEITLNDLLKSGWAGKISEICIREITKQKEKLGIEPSEWLKEGAGPKEDNFKVFNIAKDYLVITFPIYQVGAYVEGPSEVAINYNEIRDIIKPGGQLERFIK